MSIAFAISTCALGCSSLARLHWTLADPRIEEPLWPSGPPSRRSEYPSRCGGVCSCECARELEPANGPRRRSDPIPDRRPRGFHFPQWALFGIVGLRSPCAPGELSWVRDAVDPIPRLKARGAPLAPGEPTEDLYTFPRSTPDPARHICSVFIFIHVFMYILRWILRRQSSELSKKRD